MSDKKVDVIVLGAGIVGVSAAYAAQQQELSVVLVDRREPGSGGYHREFKPNPARALRRPIHDADGSFLMTPMEQGIRVTSGVELTDHDAPSSYAQIDAVEPLAREVVEFGEQVGDTWRGARPTLPDSLPMIGPAPRHAGLWLAFGNQHIGFTTGPATGAAIAAMIKGTPPSYDVTAFAPSRYI
ncbi:FAD-binding oxidoreductase [Bradyrhizobium sp. AUGA SZCCT0160]|uniref:NAD(P)/FAD-dependent oxidoreductase n=1 Tax=Bradyrhizobium sp. AUGA SZCCT0160 TaxID=2807662 RepID=UPI001BA9CFBB|nr:FAD-binding oxidoreductase [Bradyrhizobium sp. AUGA SZCCT0160]MBR1189110.1 FAD-binding oxidoreductase [Bradyrhizobium sp. AUGA SZCCT0160]